MQGLPDDLVGDVRAVEVGRVDMIHAGRNGLAENGDGSVRVLGRPPHAGAGQLHRAVAHPLDRQGRAGEREPSAEDGFIPRIVCVHICFRFIKHKHST